MSLPKKIEKNSKFLETRSLDYCFCSFFRVVSNIPEYLKNGIKTKVGKMITLMTIDDVEESISDNQVQQLFFI